ncbi:MAG: DapH/DapD/GlmU-related protein [bacterium]|nr:DapH/DapD/GlmU-related protein [bacterium]
MRDRMGRELSSGEVVQKGVNRLGAIFLEFEVMFLHWVGCVPSHSVRKLFYRLAGVKIGRGSAIHTGARFYDPRNIKIGQDSIIGEGAVLDGRDKLLIGDHVDIASQVMIYNSQHDIDSEDFGAILAPVEIGDYVFIGPRSVILPGVIIGEGAVVAAGAVVNKNVAPYIVVGGVPAQVVRERKVKNLHYRLGRARLFR